MCVVCVLVVKSIISTMTEIQEAAPSATNVAASIKFPPTKGHRRRSTSESALATRTSIHQIKTPQSSHSKAPGAERNSQKSEESRR